MWAQIALIKLHPFEQFHFGFQTLAFFNSDDAIFADLVHRFCDDRTDLRVVICRACSHLRNLFRVLHWLGETLQFFDNFAHCSINAASNHVRVRTSGDVLQAFRENRFGINRCCCGSVACILAGLACNFFHHLSAHIFVWIFQLNFLGNSHAVFSDGRCAERFFKNHNATRWAERDLDCFGEFLHAAKNALARIIVITNLFCCHLLLRM